MPNGQDQNQRVALLHLIENAPVADTVRPPITQESGEALAKIGMLREPDDGVGDTRLDRLVELANAARSHEQELAHSERALNDQLRFTQELLEVIPNPIFYKDAQQRYLGFNRAWENFFGKKRSDFIGKTVANLLQKDLAESSDRNDTEVIRTGQMLIAEVQLVNSNNELRQVLKHVGRFTSQAGDPAGTIGLLTDITDYRKVERALEASEARFRAITESAMDIVTVVDDQGVVQYLSPSVKHLLGFDPDQIIGHSQFDMVHRDDVDLLKQEFTALIARGPGTHTENPIEFRVRHQDGTWRTLESMGKNSGSRPREMRRPAPSAYYFRCPSVPVRSCPAMPPWRAGC